jgi:hypothetical protein
MELVGSRVHRFYREEVKAEVPYTVQQAVELPLIKRLGEKAGMAVAGFD